MGVMFQSGIFSWQAECIPTHGMEYIIALHSFMAGNHITYGIVSDMAHMDPAGRIWEHLQQVIFLARRILGNIEDLVSKPALLPLVFNGGKIVAAGIFWFVIFRHG